MDNNDTDYEFDSIPNDFRIGGTPDDSPEALDWNSSEIAPDPKFLTAERITIH